MQTHPTFEARASEWSVSVPYCPDSAPLADHVTRLRSWALIRRETITGSPYLSFGNEGITVHLPVKGDIAPHPETGVIRVRQGGGYVATSESIPFDKVEDTLSSMRGQLEEICGQLGAAEYRSEDRDLRRGRIVWPVRQLPGARQQRVLLAG